MRKLLLSLCLTLFAATMMAVPAKRGIYRTLRLANGTEVRAQLCGDEPIHFFRADDGTCYVADGTGTYTFTVESYLCGETTDVYNTVTNLKVGDKIDVGGFLYWYNGLQPHVTSVTVK